MQVGNLRQAIVVFWLAQELSKAAFNRVRRWIKENIMSTVSVRTEVEVDVDLSEFDTDELMAELEERGFDTKGNKISLPDDLFEQRMAMMRALWEKNDAKVIELLKTYLCDCLGRAAI